MTAAYNAAWQHLQTNRPTLTADQVRVLKKEPSANHSGVCRRRTKHVNRSPAGRDQSDYLPLAQALVRTRRCRAVWRGAARPYRGGSAVPTARGWGAGALKV